MKRLFFFTLFFFFLPKLQAQSYIYNPVTNNSGLDINGVYNFSNCLMYDVSLNRKYNQSKCDGVVGISIDDTGKGTLTFFLIEKLKFTINSCKVDGQEYDFDLINPNGKNSKAMMIIHQGKLESFSLCINNDDIWVMLLSH